MPLFALRYDLRCPPFGKADSQALANAAITQAEWADRLGFVSVALSEHHGAPDGCLPSPLVLGSAISARTERVRITIAALIVPLHDPLRLAEDLAVLDVVSGGRLIAVLAGGYVVEEFRAFGCELSGRARVMDSIVRFLERAWTGEPFEHRGVQVRVTPRPVQRPRPPLLMGGSSEAAARRAARFADGFMPSDPKFHAAYRDERVRLGHPDPGPPPGGISSFVHVATDPDAAWERIAPHALHETNAYGRWMAEAGTDGPFSPSDDAASLRASGAYAVWTPDEMIERARALGPFEVIVLHPLMGGLDPELAWESLRLIETKVLPAL